MVNESVTVDNVEDGSDDDSDYLAKEARRAARRARDGTEEAKAAARARHGTEEAKAARRARDGTEEAKAARRARDGTEEAKAAQRARHGTEEAKARRRARARVMADKQRKCYNDAELAALDKGVLPEGADVHFNVDLLPAVLPTDARKKEILAALQDDWTADDSVCAVCDCFCQPTDCVLKDPADANSEKCLQPLLAPVPGDPKEAPLHEWLQKQYNVTEAYEKALAELKIMDPTRPDAQAPEVLSRVLLSPRGVRTHAFDCPRDDPKHPDSDKPCACVPSLCVCQRCHGAVFKRRKLAKFAIRNGNYIGQLAEELRTMSYATRLLIRPYQAFGCVGSFTPRETKYGGVRITGHLFAVELNLPVIHGKLPLSPSDTPLRVIFVSPYASLKALVTAGQKAEVEKDYLINRLHVTKILKHFTDIGHRFSANRFERDQAVLDSLPDGVSPDTYTVEEAQLDGPGVANGSAGSDEDNDADADERAQGDGVPQESAARVRRQALPPDTNTVHDDVALAAGVSRSFGFLCPDADKDSKSKYAWLHSVLQKNKHVARFAPPGRGGGGEADDDSLGSESGEADTFIARAPADRQFHSDTGDSTYFSSAFPDLFPWGVGDYSTHRKIPISKEKLVEHWLRLSTRQFQRVDFVVPAYSLVNRLRLKNVLFFRAKLPSASSAPAGPVGADGVAPTRSKAQAFGSIPVAALEKFGAYQLKCDKAVRDGKRLPAAPQGESGVPAEFYREVNLAAICSPFSSAASKSHRQRVYAAHYCNGKGDVWFTISPDDAMSWRLMWYAIGDDEAAFDQASGGMPSFTKDRVPDGNFRFRTLNSNPGAAALHFEKILRAIMKHVFGWDLVRGRPFKGGGLWGVVKDWVYGVEEQGRLTLHTHMLVWLFGMRHLTLEARKAAIEERVKKYLPLLVRQLAGLAVIDFDGHQAPQPVRPQSDEAPQAPAVDDVDGDQVPPPVPPPSDEALHAPSVSEVQPSAAPVSQAALDSLGKVATCRTCDRAMIAVVVSELANDVMAAATLPQDGGDDEPPQLVDDSESDEDELLGEEHDREDEEAEAEAKVDCLNTLMDHALPCHAVFIYEYNRGYGLAVGSVLERREPKPGELQAELKVKWFRVSQLDGAWTLEPTNSEVVHARFVANRVTPKWDAHVENLICCFRLDEHERMPEQVRRVASDCLRLHKSKAAQDQSARAQVAVASRASDAEDSDSSDPETRADDQEQGGLDCQLEGCEPDQDARQYKHDLLSRMPLQREDEGSEPEDRSDEDFEDERAEDVEAAAVATVAPCHHVTDGEVFAAKRPLCESFADLKLCESGSEDACARLWLRCHHCYMQSMVTAATAAGALQQDGDAVVPDEEESDDGEWGHDGCGEDDDDHAMAEDEDSHEDDDDHAMAAHDDGESEVEEDAGGDGGMGAGEGGDDAMAVDDDAEADSAPNGGTDDSERAAEPAEPLCDVCESGGYQGDVRVKEQLAHCLDSGKIELDLRYSDQEHANSWLRQLWHAMATFAAGLSSANLHLPPEAETLLHQCPECKGRLTGVFESEYKEMQRRALEDSEEPRALRCPNNACKEDGVLRTVTTTSRIAAALGGQFPTEDEMDELMWKGMPKRADVTEDQWKLSLARLQLRTNLHRWQHAASCFKGRGNRKFCRYSCPHPPEKTTCVEPDDTKSLSTYRFLQERFPACAFLSECSLDILSVFPWNNCTRVVRDQKVSMYYGAYLAKYCNDHIVALGKLLEVLHKQTDKEREREKQDEKTNAHQLATAAPGQVQPSELKRQPRSEYSIGCGRLMTAIRAMTGTTVGANLCAYVAIGNEIFESSRKSTNLPVAQALAFLQGEAHNVTFTARGMVMATIYDYVYRPRELQRLGYWRFLSEYELVQAKASKKHQQRVMGGGEQDEDEEEATEVLDDEAMEDGDAAECSDEEGEDIGVTDDERDSTDREDSDGEADGDEGCESRSRVQHSVENADARGSRDEECADDIDAHVQDDLVGTKTTVRKGRTELHLLQGHPQRGKRVVVKRRQTAWVLLLGKRLPDLLTLESPTPDSSCDADDTVDFSPEALHARREQYGQAALIAFRRFRELSDLKQGDTETWWQAYQRVKPALLADTIARETLANMQNFYEAFARGRCEPGFEDENPHLRHRQELREGDDEDTIDLALADAEEREERVTNDAMFLALETVPVERKGLRNTSTIVPLPISATDLTKALETLQKPAEFALPFASSNMGGPQVQPAAESDADVSDDEDDKEEAHTAQTDKVVKLDYLKRALRKREHKARPGPIASGHPPALPANRPSIQKHAFHWALNKKQHLAFATLAATILDGVVRDEPNVDAEIKAELKAMLPEGGQLRMYLGGSGGTGKSRVIDSVVDFARRWLVSDSVVVCAWCGCAAMNIGGCTVHTALGSGIQYEKTKDPTSEMITAWDSVVLVIVDEVSMMEPKFLAFMSARLKKLKGLGDSGALFGGIHICFAGDFYQLAPIGKKLYRTARQLSSEESDSDPIRTAEGRHIWQNSLTDVVELLEQKRQTDPDWIEALGRWRINQPTQKDLEQLARRKVSKRNQPTAGTITAVAENKARVHLMNYYDDNHHTRHSTVLEPDDQNWQARGSLLVQARVLKGRGRALTGKQHRYVMQRSEIAKKPIRTDLLLVRDNEYSTTENFRVDKGVSNGTKGYFVDAVLRSGTKIRHVPVSGGGHVHAVYADEVKAVILSYSADTWKERTTFPTLGKGCFPVESITSSKKLTFGNVDSNDKRTLTVKHLPVMPASAQTGHKLQGQSLDTLLLGDMGQGANKYGSSGWLYVALSRVRSLEGLFLLIDINMDPKKYKPRLDVMREMQRLREIEQATLNRLRLAGVAEGAVQASDEAALGSCAAAAHRTPARRKRPRRQSQPAAPSKKTRTGKAVAAGDAKRALAFAPDVFDAEGIEKHRVHGGQHQFLVKWKGCSAEHNSWEPSVNLLGALKHEAARLVADYKRNQTLAVSPLAALLAVPAIAAGNEPIGIFQEFNSSDAAQPTEEHFWAHNMQALANRPTYRDGACLYRAVLQGLDPGGFGSYQRNTYGQCTNSAERKREDTIVEELRRASVALLRSDLSALLPAHGDTMEGGRGLKWTTREGYITEMSKNSTYATELEITCLAEYLGRPIVLVCGRDARTLYRRRIYSPSKVLDHKVVAHGHTFLYRVSRAGQDDKWVLEKNFASPPAIASYWALRGFTKAEGEADELRRMLLHANHAKVRREASHGLQFIEEGE